MFYPFTEEEWERLLVIKQIASRSINQRAGACKLGITARQLRRIMHLYKHEGANGIKARARGGNRAHSEEFKESVLSTVRQKYSDFGPTFAAEKLYECDNLKINREILRQWMIEAEIWKAKAPHKQRIHQSRDRRPEFEQIHKNIKPPVIADRKGLDVVFEKKIYIQSHKMLCVINRPHSLKNPALLFKSSR